MPKSGSFQTSSPPYEIVGQSVADEHLTVASPTVHATFNVQVGGGAPLGSSPLKYGWPCVPPTAVTFADEDGYPAFSVANPFVAPKSPEEASAVIPAFRAAT